MTEKSFGITIACLLTFFVITSIITAQPPEQPERPIVKIVYFIPKDLRPQRGIEAKLDKLIKDVQQAYTDIMKGHGFGRKTFRFETDARGNAVVHYVVGRFTDKHYHELGSTWKEIEERFDTSKDIYLAAIDISSMGSVDPNEVCGLGGGTSASGGIALIPASGPCFDINVAAHELGHAFGLMHDYRGDAKRISSNIYDWMVTSYCAGEWLDAHRAFNAAQPVSNEWPTIEMLPPKFASPPNAIRLRFEVTDPDGLHQAQLHARVYGRNVCGNALDLGLIAYKRLNSKTSTFELTTNQLRLETDSVRLSIIDKNGNFTSKQFPIDITPLLPQPKVVLIPDANLAAAVREEVGSSITTHTMLNLTHLDILNRGITDLTGLKHALGLVELNLGGEEIQGKGLVNSNTVSDFSPLERLTQLTLLNLSNTPITDVSFLSGLFNLTILQLGNTFVSHISPLAGLTQLRFLDVSNTPISDVSPLSGLTQLTSLVIQGTRVNDISPLSGLTQLTSLGVSHTPITDISPLSGLTRLTWLTLSNTHITDVSPLSGLTQLETLELYTTAINDVSPLAELTQLEYLALAYNSITDVSPLAELTQLEYLALAYNSITDVSPLAELTQLDFLVLSNNNITDVSPLVGLNLTGRQWDSTGLYLDDNPLNYASIRTHIPAMQARGVGVSFDPRTPTTLTKRLGDIQQGKPSKVLSSPFVVEVRDEKEVPFAGVPITFTVTAGGGKLSTKTTMTDTAGRAQTTLTLGPNLAMNTVHVTAAEIQQPIIFTATATDNPPPTFRKPTTFSIAENATAIGTVKATDVDTQDRVTGYSISPTAGEDSARFSITPTGVLRFKTAPDYERPTTAARNNEYIVLVSATGGTGERARTGTHPFIISVTDVDEPPATPITPRVIPATPTSLIVSWAAPANTGPPLTYNVRYRVGNGGKITESNYKGAATNFTIEGLTQGKRYQVQVRAKNDEGTSAWSPSGIGIPQASPSINFPDAVLRAKIAEALGKASNTPITAVDMLELTKLEVPNANIRDLTGLEHAHNLRGLNLGGEYISGEGEVNSNSVSDFSPLFGLAQLTRLTLNFNSLSDISFLSTLTQLTYLHLGSNNISDVAPLSGLPRLTWLYLWNNSITDISPLSGLTQLISLHLESNTITDVSALASLTQLTGLSLSGNPISNLAPLAGLTQLTSLSLHNNKIRDLSALTGLTQLTYLGLNSNTISDVSPLSDLTQLTILHLNSNAITAVEALTELTQLTVLDIRHNAILDVSPLVGLNLTGTQWQSTGLYLERNPLNYASIHRHIPAMQAKGIEVQFGPRTPTALVKVAGAAQQGVVNATLTLPFVVEVRDQQNRAFAGVPVTFSVTEGGGRLSATTTATNRNGRVQAHLTLGRTPGTNTVRVTATEISQSVQFIATGTSLSAIVAIPDTNLRTQITAALGKAHEHAITVADMLSLTELQVNNANVRDLAGLQQASNLTTLSLNNNHLSDISRLAGLRQLTRLSLNGNNISDATPLAGLMQLEHMSLNDNKFSDVTLLAELTQLQTLSLRNNNISDVSSLETLTHLQTLQLRGNLLNYPSLHTHIPAIQAGGATVSVDTRTPTTLTKISGTHGVAGKALPLIVEVQDEQGFGFAGVPVTFSIAAGGGSLSTANIITDHTGRTRTTFTLGATPGKHTVLASATDVPRPASFTITAIDANSPVAIRDASLRAKIAETLGKSRGVQLTAGDMLGLTQLETPNANIRDLIGLEHAHNLNHLNLGYEYISGEGTVNNNAVSDFSSLFGLAQLTSLNLSFNSLPDLSFLSNLPQLTNLNLYNTTISDVAPLAKLTQLTSLDIRNNPISDVAPLTKLTRLTSLYLDGPTISDISALTGLTQLTLLGIWNTSVSDISVLSTLTQLTTLYLGGNAISDISPLAGLTQLSTLRLNSNAVTDISPLAGLTQLIQLELGSNPLIDVSALSGLIQMQYLYLSSTAISDVSPLETLTQLTTLDLRYNTISDVSPLVGLNLTGTQWDSTGLYLDGNPLNYASLHTHIPAMQARGIEVKFDPRTYPALDIISGAGQQAGGSGTLGNPLVVAAIGVHGTPMQDVSVTFTVTGGGGELSAANATTDARGRAATTFTLGPDPGRHFVRATAPTLESQVTFIAIAVETSEHITQDVKTADVETPEPIAGDVNEDGVVSLEDMELAAARLGQTGENTADLNGDGVVDAADLLLIAAAIAQENAAPSLHPQAIEMFTAEEVKHWLRLTYQMTLTDPAYLRGIAVLERLLALLLPKETALLANYPNPFNPETWIPYQLAKPAAVILRIYSVKGELVRTLAFGHQRAGAYKSRRRAAYWDGRNTQGEKVASGIYFYTLTAGDYTATRKMLIRK